MIKVLPTQNISKINFKSKTPSPQEGDVGMSNAAKLAIGATAVAASAIAGILIHKNIKLNKNIKELLKEIDFDSKGPLRALKPLNDDFFDNNILQSHIDEILKLPKKEQEIKLRELKKVLGDGRYTALVSDINSGRINNLPQATKDAIYSKDQLKAYKAYIEYCDTLFSKSKTADKTVQESIEIILGKNSKIKPHSYNSANEAEFICGYIDVGGYKDLAINSKNEIAIGLNHSSNKVLNPSLISSPFEFKVASTDGKITHYLDDGKQYVQIDFPNGRSGNKLILASKDGKLTPAQQDLLSLQGKLTDDDLELFTRMTSNWSENRGFIVTKQDILQNVWGYLDFMNYDVILSTIQSLAAKVK